jgi:hypothetical protein
VVPVALSPESYNSIDHHALYTLDQGLSGVCAICDPSSVDPGGSDGGGSTGGGSTGGSSTGGDSTGGGATVGGSLDGGEIGGGAAREFDANDLETDATRQRLMPIVPGRDPGKQSVKPSRVDQDLNATRGDATSR